MNAAMNAPMKAPMNAKPVSVTLALVLAAGLGGCGRHERMRDAALCPDFRAAVQPAAAPAGAPDAAAPVDDCVRRWAFSLAGARDRAEVVAGAAVAACDGALSHWNQAALAQAAPAGADQMAGQMADQAGAPVEALSLTTGQPTNPMAAHAAFARDRALLYVVEARAGRCAPPPAKNGVPVGLPPGA